MPRMSRYGPNVVPPAIDLELATYLDEHYRGKWVALDDDRVVAAGDSGLEVYEQAKALGIAVPFLHRVPVPTGRPVIHGHVRWA